MFWENWAKRTMFACFGEIGCRAVLYKCFGKMGKENNSGMFGNLGKANNARMRLGNRVIEPTSAMMFLRKWVKRTMLISLENWAKITTLGCLGKSDKEISYVFICRKLPYHLNFPAPNSHLAL